MQVNLSTNMGAGAPEAASKPDAVDGSASAFFAEMGQAWNAVEAEAPTSMDASCAGSSDPKLQAIPGRARSSDAAVEQNAEGCEAGEECGDASVSTMIVDAMTPIPMSAEPVIMSLDLSAPLSVSDRELLESVDAETAPFGRIETAVEASDATGSQPAGTVFASHLTREREAIVRSANVAETMKPDAPKDGSSGAASLAGNGDAEGESALLARFGNAPGAMRMGVEAVDGVEGVDGVENVPASSAPQTSSETGESLMRSAPQIVEKAAMPDPSLIADQGFGARGYGAAASTHAGDVRRGHDGAAIAENPVDPSSGRNGVQPERAAVSRNELPPAGGDVRLVKDALMVQESAKDVVTRDAGPAVSKTPAQASASGSAEVAPPVMNDADAGSAGSGRDGLPNGKALWTGVQREAESSAQGSDVRQPFSIEHGGMGTPRAVSAGMTEKGASASSSRESAGAEPKSLMLELAERIQLQVREGRSEVRIQLKPESLGRIEIRAENAANGVIARITAESGSVKSHLEANMQILQQSLQEQGLRVDRIQVVVQNGFDAQTPSGYHAHSGNSGNGHERGGTETAGRGEAFGESSIDETPNDQIAWRSLDPNVRFYTVA